MSSLFGSRFGNRPKTEETKIPPTPPSQAIQMPTRPTALTQQPLGFETVLGPSSVLEGKLKSGGNIRLDGTFTGTLEISGNVLVGETANIEADIDAKNISIAGAVRGNVSGNKVQLLRTGRVWGDISATALTTEEGAFIDGKISMKSAPPVVPIPMPVEPEAEEIVAPSKAEPEAQAAVEPEADADAEPQSPQPATDDVLEQSEDVTDSTDAPEPPKEATE